MNFLNHISEDVFGLIQQGAELDLLRNRLHVLAVLECPQLHLLAPLVQQLKSHFQVHEVEHVEQLASLVCFESGSLVKLFELADRRNQIENKLIDVLETYNAVLGRIHAVGLLECLGVSLLHLSQHLGGLCYLL